MQTITPQPRNVGIYLVTPTGPAILSYIPRELAVNPNTIFLYSWQIS